MAKLIQGINGGFSGKVGPVVGYSLLGKAIIRSRPVGRRSAFSKGELTQQIKFKLTAKLLSPLIPLLNITYKNLAAGMTGFNKASSYNLKNGFTGVYPDVSIDFKNVLLGRGDLRNAASLVADIADGQIHFHWKDNSGEGIAAGEDQVYVAVYCEEIGTWIHKLNAAVRSAEAYTLDVKRFTGKPVHVYMGFISVDGREVSDSAYLGKLDLP